MVSVRSSLESSQSPSPSPNLETDLRAAVAERLGPERFDLWFGEGVHLGIDGDALWIGVPNAFFREWIQGHYGQSLEEAARAVTGRSLRVQFRVDSAEASAAPRPALLKGGRSRGPATKPGLESTPVDPRPSSVPPPTPTLSPAANPRASKGEAVSSTPRLEQAAPASVPAPVPVPVPVPVSVSTQVRATAERPRGLGRSNRRLENYVTGPGNRLAHAAAMEMAQTAGASFNPLVIHGGIGLGKTHLLEGIAQTLRARFPGMNVMQITAESFTNMFLDAMRHGTLQAFRLKYRALGALLIDDIHFLAAKRATQDEMLHTFNALMAEGAPIVMTTDQHPKLITKLPDELVTRFLAGMVVRVDPPDLATRQAILRAKAESRGVELPQAVVNYIAENLRASVRELEGAMNSVLAHAQLSGKRIDLNLAKSALRDTIRHTAQAVALRDVERAVCQLFQVDADTLKSDGRSRAVAYPRMLAMYLARKHTGCAYSEIGRFFGGRNHSTVIAAEKKVCLWLREEKRNGVLAGFETASDILAALERALGA